MSEEVLIQQMIFDLRPQGQHLALVAHEGQVFYSLFPEEETGPSSAAVKLMQGLFDRFVDHSFFILRQRLYCTEELSAMVRGMLKTVAKRAQGSLRGHDHGVKWAARVQEIGGGELLIRSPWLTEIHRWSLSQVEELREKCSFQWLERLAAQNPRGEVLHDYDRGMACVLFSADGELLSFGLNSNSKNKTLHAEVNMVQSYFLRMGRKIPAGASIYTTCKPCKMCAGMIHDWAEQPESLRIYFRDRDKASSSTVLDTCTEFHQQSPVAFIPERF